MASCADLFIPRLRAGDPPLAPPADRCAGLTLLECYGKLDLDLGADSPTRAVLRNGRAVGVLPAKDGAADEEMLVDLSFKHMSDFTPDKVAEQVPALAELLKMRRQLEELLGYMDGKVNAEKRIAQLLQNEPLLMQVADEAMKKEG